MLQETGHTLALVLPLEQEHLGGHVKGRRFRSVEAQGELRQLEGAPRPLGDPRGELGASIGKVHDHLVHQAPRERLLGGHLATGVEHLASVREADELRQAPIGPGTREDPKGELGLTECRPGCRKPKVAGQGKLGAAAERGTVDEGDHGPAVRLEALGQPPV